MVGTGSRYPRMRGGIPILAGVGGELCSPPLFLAIHPRAVALMVEQRSPKPRVVGSSPACPAAETHGAL